MTTLSSLVYTDVQLANVTNLQVTTAASFGQANLAFSQANAAFLAANNAVTDFSPAFIQANTARNHANAAFFKANTAVTDFSPAFNQANAAYAQANLALPASGGTISGNLIVDGTLTVSGNVSFVDSQTLKISDPLIYLAGNNYTSDTVDIGFIANYVNATGQNVHTGFFRDATNKEYYVFEGYDVEPTNNHINPQGNNFTISVLNATLKTSNLILGGANAIGTIGAAFNKANAALPNTSGAAFAGNLSLPTGNLAVGIATANAGAKLQVYNTSGNSELWITADNGYDPVLRMTGEAGDTSEGFIIRYDNSVGDTYFENKFAATASYHFLTPVVEALTIHTDGKVGVGTTEPQYILDVKGKANISSTLSVSNVAIGTVTPSSGRALTLDSATNYFGIDFQTSGTTRGKIIQEATGNMYYDAGAALIFRSNGATERMQISAAGDVAIGNAAGATNTLRFFDVYNTDTGASAGAIQRFITSNVAGTGVTSLDLIKYKNGGAYINNNEPNAAAFTAFQVSGSEKLRISSTGINVTGAMSATSLAGTAATGSGASGTWGINISGTAATATTATNTTQVGGISSDRVMMKRRSRIHTSDGTSLNSSITAPEMGFTYGGSGEPAGPYIAFGGLGGNIDYSCQLVGEYNNSGNNFKIRTRNDDSATWNSWRTILTDGNYSSYALPLSGGTMSGTIYSPINSLVIGNNGGVTRGYLYQDTSGFGLLTSSGGWGIRVDYGASSVTVPGRLYANEYIQFDNITGLFSPTNSAYFQPSNLSYGPWKINGTRNGWGGLEFENASTSLMMNTDGYGFHYNGVGWRMYVSGGSLYVPGNITAYWSDRRLKENLRPIGKEASDILSKLTAYRFNWNDKVENFGISVKPGKEEIGLIAQEVQAILPDAVTVNKAASKVNEDGSEDEADYLTIDWNKITPLLVQALNDTTRELNELKQLLKDKGLI